MIGVEIENKVVVPEPDFKLASDETLIVLKETDSSIDRITMENEDLKVKAERAGESVTDLVESSIHKGTHFLKAKLKSLHTSGVLDPGYVQAKRDSADIARLGPLVTGLATAFEDTITAVRKQPYEEQVKMLTGYRKLMEEQINVINSRIGFVKRVR